MHIGQTEFAASVAIYQLDVVIQRFDGSLTEPNHTTREITVMWYLIRMSRFDRGRWLCGVVAGVSLLVAGAQCPNTVADDDRESVVEIQQPQRLAAKSIACERIPLGEPGDY